MIPLALLQRVLPYVLAVVSFVGFVVAVERYGERQANAAWTAKWNTQAQQLADARAVAERVQREEEQRRQAAINEVRTDAQKQIQQAADDAAAAGVVADSLREQSRRLAARASQACGNTSTAQRGKAASTPGLVLADVFGRADGTAAELAAAYDRARAAGGACERAYDAVRGER